MALVPRRKRAGAVLRSASVDNIEYGPAMTALNQMQRDFVVAYWQSANATEAARMAGYALTNNDSAKSKAWKLTHSPKVKAAIAEFGGNVLSAEGIKVAIKALIDIAGNDEHTKQLDAAKTILDRIGITPATQHNVNVQVTLTRDEKVAKLKELADQAGLAHSEVLGSIVDLDEAEYEEVDAG